jgi:hypothetical protein
MPYHYDPNQPRVPRGHSDGGQWTDGGGGLIQPAFAGAARYVAVKTIEAGLALYTWMSARNSYDQQAIIAIRAREYLRNEGEPIKVEDVRVLNRNEVKSICERFKLTQRLVNEAAAEVRAEGKNLPPAEYGTAVHSKLKDKVKAEGDPNFRGEVSYLKGKEEGAGQEGWIRIDVLDRVSDDMVCVYDLKTGRRPLSVPRIIEIARNVSEAYPKTRRFVVSEIGLQ